MESDALIKWVTLRCPAPLAFQLFTVQLSRWWPMGGHSVFEEPNAVCVIETEAGGRIYEVSRDGGQALWGRVVICEPGRRLCFTWHPGRTPTTAQYVTVIFHPSEGGTRLELRHEAWAALGPNAELVKRQYATGWEEILTRYASLANMNHL
jgi:uncharacterized protein YndB with AHSA1/START domain